MCSYHRRRPVNKITSDYASVRDWYGLYRLALVRVNTHALSSLSFITGQGGGRGRRW